MIDDRQAETKSGQIFRLASLPPYSLDVILLQRGISSESIPEILATLAQNEVPFSPDEMVRDTFTPKAGYATPFPAYRYGDGSAAVYYAALERETCIAEVTYHLSVDAAKLNYPRYYSLVGCLFSGQVFVLLGQENTYPDLISIDRSGYPFCQDLANRCRRAVDALYVPSARNTGGVCVPVFRESAISSPSVVFRGQFTMDVAGVVTFEVR